MKERGFNRKLRRSVSKSDLLQHLTKTEGGRATIDGIITNLNRSFPLEHGLDRATFISYMAGPRNSKAFLAYIKSLLVDPVSLIARLAPELDSSFQLPSIVRDQGKQLVDMFNPFLLKFSEFLAQLPEGDAFEKMRNEAKALPSEMMMKVRRDIIVKHMRDNWASKAKAPLALSNAELDAMALPTLDVLIAAVTRYLNELVTTAGARRNVRLFTQSDGADLFHATYIPYVDIFRCDTAWTGILTPIGKTYGTRLVGRIEDLLPTIRSQLSSHSL